jgi:hypothetical protein
VANAELFAGFLFRTSAQQFAPFGCRGLDRIAHIFFSGIWVNLHAVPAIFIFDMKTFVSFVKLG